MEPVLNQSPLLSLKKWCLIAACCWTFVFALSISFLVYRERQQVLDLGTELGRFSIQKDYVYRLWNAIHGGVYVPITKKTPPNPYLGHIANRDVEISDIPYTLMNPAYMTRQAHEISQDRYGIKGHITSLKTLRPENKPDDWERKALQQLEQGGKEVVEYITGSDGTPSIRVMMPMETQESCLKCHAQQGYKIGDVRGGISATVNLDTLLPMRDTHITLGVVVHLLMYGAGVVGLIFFYRKSAKDRKARELAENETLKQSTMLQGIVDHISSGIAIYEAIDEGEDFIIKNLNIAGLHTAEKELEELVGKRVSEAFPGIKEMGLFDVFKQVYHSGEPQSLPLSFYEDSEVSQWPENYVYKLPTGEIIAVYDDLTEKKRYTDQLEKKSEEWEKTFESISDFITIQDLDKKILRANKAVYNYFQLEPEQLIGKTCYQLYRGTDEPCPDCPGISISAANNNTPKLIKHSSLGKTFEVQASPLLDKQDKIIQWVYVAKDVTEILKMEQELRQAQKMEAIGTLAGGIAHDFNNILTAIIGYAEMATDDLPVDSRARSDIAQVLMAGERARQLVKQILTFSRKNEDDTQPLRMRLVVKEAMKMLRASLPSTIEIQTELDGGDATVLADPTAIHQVVVNLCTNAAHALANQKGKIEVSLHEEDFAEIPQPEIWHADPGSFLLLTVTDNGQGMDQQTKDRIFEPYYTTKERGKGTGLGLSLVHGIIQQYHGFITIDSSPGEGTIFKVALPCLEEKEVALSPQGNGQLPGGKESILIVDDEQPIGLLLSIMLKRLGYTVTTFDNSETAWQAFAENPQHFDLVLTDLTMPGLTGLDLAHMIHEKQPAIPIILISGQFGNLDQAQLESAGIRETLTKPVSKEILATAIRNVLC